MKRHWIVVLALSSAAAVAATPHTSSAQQFARNGYQQRVAKNPYQQSAARNVYQAKGQSSVRAVQAHSPAAIDQLPTRQVEPRPAGSGNYGDPFVDEPQSSFGPAEFTMQDGYGYGDYVGMSGGCGDGCCSGGCCGGGCGQVAYVTGARCYVYADYLHIEAGLSDAVAYVENQLVNGTTTFDRQDLDFDFTSSYRFGGGIRINDCGDEVRFGYTRFRSDASSGFVSEFENGQPIFLVPFKIPQEPGGRVDIDADVDVNAFDWDVVKNIPLGCKPCCDCGDACGGGCGDCCSSCCEPCPLWDLSWSLGLRYADADWNRSWKSYDTGGFGIGGAVSRMDFSGAGPKVGVEGRRYFFDSGWLSGYAKGDIALLWGEVEFALHQSDQLSIPTQVNAFKSNHQIIPVTEIEVGFSAQITCNARFTGGYLASAWHDLGFRDDFLVDPQLTFPLFYDDANLLGFHGWFVRAELSY